MIKNVFLRKKPITQGRLRLYLDFYPPIPHPKTGELTRREFLDLFIYNDHESEEPNHNKKDKDVSKSPSDKRVVKKPATIKLSPYQIQHNTQTLEIAHQILLQRELELSKPEVYSSFEKEQIKLQENGEKNFVEYFKQLANKRTASNLGNWLSAYMHTPDKLTSLRRFKLTTLRRSA